MLHAGVTAPVQRPLRGYLNGEEGAMDFDLTAEQRRWRDLAREFAQGTIRPQAEALDREARFPYAIVEEMAGLGFMGMTLPPDYGGTSADFISYCLAIE